MALNAFFDQIISGPVKIGVIGSGCSPATEPTAEISHYYNITHVRKYTLSHPQFTHSDHCITENFRGRKLSQILWFCGYLQKFPPRNFGLWRPLACMAKGSNPQRFSLKKSKVFSLESFLLYGIQWSLTVQCWHRKEKSVRSGRLPWPYRWCQEDRHVGGGASQFFFVLFQDPSVLNNMWYSSASSTWWALWRVSVYLMSTQVTRSPKALLALRN